MDRSRHLIAFAKKAICILMQMALIGAIVPIAMIAASPSKAYAGDSVYLQKSGYVFYAGWFTARMEANGVPAICTEPALKSPSAGWYEKDYAWQDDARMDEAIRALFYFSYFGPAYDPSLWPSAYYDGSAMGWDEHVVALHLAVSACYSDHWSAALEGVLPGFLGWAQDEVIRDTVNRACARESEVPDSFRIYSVGGNGAQHVMSFDPTGWLKIDKDSANPLLTDGNPCYDLTGIRYGVYADEGCTQLEATLTCDAEGVTEEAELPTGTHWIRELDGSTTGSGYAIDVEAHAVSVPPGASTTVEVSDEPQHSPQCLVVQKRDAETGAALPQGSATLEDAEFTVRYYAGFYDTAADAEASGAPTRTWILRTRANGTATLSDEDKVGGDDLYRTREGTPTLPLGTILIQETKAPIGYLLGEQEVSVRRVEPKSSPSPLLTFNERQEEERVKRGDLEFVKAEEDNMHRLSGIPFSLTSETTGERHILVTDANGYASTHASWNPHSQNTNGNDDAAEGSFDDQAGVWFGHDQAGNSAALSDERGALPYDTYTLEELPCSKNEALVLLKVPDITIARDSTTVQLGTLDDPSTQSAVLMTCAYDAADMDKYVMADPQSAIRDVVQYMDLTAGGSYSLQATLIFADTGEPLTDDAGAPCTGSVAFTPEASNGKITVTIPFDARRASGRDVVVYERLFRDGVQVAAHEDPSDIDQQVRVVAPRIATTAVDGNDADKLIETSANSTIVDTVRFDNLVAGKDYFLKGALMLLREGQAEALTDETGSPITQEVRFTPDAANGSVDVIFALDALRLDDGAQIVVYEQLLTGDEIIATHEDPEDAGQTVCIIRPSISTTATDGEDGDGCIVADPLVVVDDTIRYDGLVTKEQYSIYGILMDKATGLPLRAPTADDPDAASSESGDEQTAALQALWQEIKASFGVSEGESTVGASFDADRLSQALDANPDLSKSLVFAQTSLTPAGSAGEHHMTFSFDATRWMQASQPIDVVAYEIITKGERTVALHADLDDEGQTVRIAPSDIDTEATDGADGDHLVLPSLDATVIDTVRYANLIPGREYAVHGRLMDKATGRQVRIDDEPVEQTVLFTPNASEGEVEVSFTLDTTRLLGKELVAFESVTKDGREVAADADLEDADQTVAIAEGPRGARLPQTGDTARARAVLCTAAALMALIGCAAALKRLRQRRPT